MSPRSMWLYIDLSCYELHTTESCPVKGVILYGGNDIRYFGSAITALPHAYLFPQA